MQTHGRLQDRSCCVGHESARDSRRIDFGAPTFNSAGKFPEGNISVKIHLPVGAQSKRYKFPFLLRGFQTSRPGDVHSIDVSYKPIKKDLMYLFAVIDVYGRQSV